jgi:membrane protein YdbS with pleckstrin-like domain
MITGVYSMSVDASFSNTSMPSIDLPQLAHLNFEALSPRYAKSNRYINLFSMAFIISILFIVKFQRFIPLSTEASDVLSFIIFSIAFVGFISTVYTIMADKRKFYSLREQDLNYRSGVIFSKTVSQPMLRIQHVELKRGPIDRKTGLAKLQVFSAGGAMHTFEIPGLPLETAESIRQFILDHKDVNQHG